MPFPIIGLALGTAVRYGGTHAARWGMKKMGKDIAEKTGKQIAKKSFRNAGIGTGASMVASEATGELSPSELDHAPADMDMDGDMDSQDLEHAQKVHDLGFEGQISAGEDNRPVLTAMDASGGDGSVSMDMDASYMDYINDIQNDSPGIER